jgi:hypothetical protein
VSDPFAQFKFTSPLQFVGDTIAGQSELFVHPVKKTVSKGLQRSIAHCAHQSHSKGS